MAGVMNWLRKPPMATRYEHDLRLFRSRLAKVALVAGAVIYVLIPLGVMPSPLEGSNYQLSILNYVGIYAIAAIGLNLLIGYTGQISLGHAFFLGMGSYVWAHFGGEQKLPLPVWLLLAAVIGAAVGALIGPFALRLKGNYLAIVSLGLVFIGIHIWKNWESVTGGFTGFSGDRAARIGGLNFARLNIFGHSFNSQQGYFLLIWALVALAALLAKNIVRTRPGRAMQAVRDRDIAAAVIGVSLPRYKVGAFAVSSAYASVAGALLGSFNNQTAAEAWNLFLSIQFIAIIIVGGVGTIFGSILGAFFVAGAPRIVEELAPRAPFITQTLDISVDVLNQLLFGLVIVLFLMLEPRGLAGIWFRIKAYFKTWPFSY